MNLNMLEYEGHLIYSLDPLIWISKTNDFSQEVRNETNRYIFGGTWKTMGASFFLNRFSYSVGN